MIHGLDTSFLISVEVAGHPRHNAARAQLQRLIKAGDTLALVPQVLAEFIHVVTDPRRFAAPLALDTAVGRANTWWNASEVVHVYPTAESTATFLAWLAKHELGRKRLLDTLLAATLHTAKITSLLTLDREDFIVLGCFNCPVV